MASDVTPAGSDLSTANCAVRIATADDAVGIAETHVASWRSAYRGLLPQTVLDGLSVERRTAGWREQILNSSCLVHVAIGAARQPVGFIATGKSRDSDAGCHVGELQAIYLSPELWGRGTGSRLHDVAISALAAAPFGEATLWVLESNSRSRSFYQWKGWQPDGTVKRDSIGGADVVEVRYRRSLHLEPLA